MNLDWLLRTCLGALLVTNPKHKLLYARFARWPRRPAQGLLFESWTPVQVCWEGAQDQG